MQQYLYLTIAVVSGIMLAVQAPLNSELGRVVKSPVYGALLSFLMGLIVLVVYCVVNKNVQFGNVRAALSIPWYYWAGGVLGAFYVAAVILLAPKLGVALTFGLSVAGQMIFGLLIDHYGWLGIPAHTVNWPRMLGVGLIIAGVALIRSN